MMDDLISRQAAIDMIHSTFAKSLARDMAEKCIQSVSSAQRWIPVAERLPEESQLCLVTENSLLGSEVCTRYFNRRGDGGFWSGWGNTPVIAWMPLPELYRGNRNETD